MIIVQVCSTSMVVSPSIEAENIFHPSIPVVPADNSRVGLSSRDDIGVIILISKTTGISKK